MKLCRFEIEDRIRIGKVVGDRVVDLGDVAGVGSSMRTLIEDLPALRGALEAESGRDFPLAKVRLLAPIVDPQKFLAIGMNYTAHAAEAEAAGIPVPTSQAWFNKQVSCITGPYDPIELPKASDKIDYEGELAFIIGQRCHDVSEAEAHSVIAGYLLCNDVSARDWQARSPTVTLGKSFDTHGPIGPWITTADEVPDAEALTLSLSVNGEERQRADTSGLIYSIAAQIAYLSTVMTLEPGDIIATGTPSGVGMASGHFLADGDIVRLEIQGLGYIENRVSAEL